MLSLNEFQQIVGDLNKIHCMSGTMKFVASYSGRSSNTLSHLMVWRHVLQRLSFLMMFSHQQAKVMKDWDEGVGVRGRGLHFLWGGVGGMGEVVEFTSKAACPPAPQRCSFGGYTRSN